MNPTVKTNDLVDALKIRSAEKTAFINRLTGRVVQIETELLAAARSRRPLPEDLPQEALEGLAQARVIVADKGKLFLPAPKPEDFPEYKTVLAFIAAMEDRTTAFDLSQAIKSRGAFRQFKAALEHFGLREAWKNYRERALVDFALQWAKKHGLTCVATTTRRRI